jgi:hypothetical protein
MKMIVLFGPQGSGNHLFGKIFSLHDSVHGWKDSLESEGYFIPHYKEPFNHYWNNLDQIDIDIMGGKQYAVTSISSPYIENWLPKVPPVHEFVRAVESLGIEVQPVVIGRDRNILTHQQTRLRGGPSWGTVPQLIKWMHTPPFYVSQELLYLYRRQYIKSLSHWLNFPLNWEDARIDEILKQDANEKYIHAADPWWLDDHVNSILTPPNSETEEK